MEEGDERLEEDRVVKEAVDRRQPRLHAAELLGEQRLEEARLWVYPGAQHGGSDPFGDGAAKAVGAIVPSSLLDREHLPAVEHQLSGTFHRDFFRGK
jgi:hypothetical protein